MNTSVSNSIIIRLKLENKSGVLTSVLKVISDLGGQVGAIDIIKVDDEDHTITRDITKS